MKRLKESSLTIFILLFVLSAMTFADDFHYATTKMTWKEFFSGELGDSVDNIDAYTSATSLKRFPDVITNNDDSITGLKNIPVRMNDEVFKKNFSNPRYTFSEKIFDKYKPVNEDGSFGAMISESKLITDAKVSLKTGADSAWGNYVLVLESEALKSIKPTENLFGAILETTDGARYALRPAENYWRKSAAEIALTVDDSYYEIHGTGVVRDYKYFSGIVGKTIDKIIYLVRDSDSLVISNLEIKIPKVPTVRATSSGTKENLEVKFEFSNDTAATYEKISKVIQGGGKKAVTLSDENYIYDSENAILIIKDPKANFYQVIFESSDESKAPNIRAGFYVED